MTLKKEAKVKQSNCLSNWIVIDFIHGLAACLSSLSPLSALVKSHFLLPETFTLVSSLFHHLNLCEYEMFGEISHFYLLSYWHALAGNLSCKYSKIKRLLERKRRRRRRRRRREMEDSVLGLSPSLEAFVSIDRYTLHFHSSMDVSSRPFKCTCDVESSLDTANSCNMHLFAVEQSLTQRRTQTHADTSEMFEIQLIQHSISGATIDWLFALLTLAPPTRVSTGVVIVFIQVTCLPISHRVEVHRARYLSLWTVDELKRFLKIHCRQK